MSGRESARGALKSEGFVGLASFTGEEVPRPAWRVDGGLALLPFRCAALGSGLDPGRGNPVLALPGEAEVMDDDA